MPVRKALYMSVSMCSCASCMCDWWVLPPNLQTGEIDLQLRNEALSVRQCAGCQGLLLLDAPSKPDDDKVNNPTVTPPCMPLPICMHSLEGHEQGQTVVPSAA